MNGHFSTGLGRLIEAADIAGAAVMLSNSDNIIVYTNPVLNRIYTCCGGLINQTYDTFVSRCIDKKLLDDPLAYKNSQDWITRAKKYRRNTKFGQYLIRHHTGRVYLVRHHADEYGVLSIRLDITDSFRDGLREVLSKGFGVDQSLGERHKLTSYYETNIAVGVFSPSSVLLDADKELLDLLDRDNGLSLQRLRLYACSAKNTETIHRLVSEYCAAREHTPSRVLRVPKRDGEGYYIAKIGLMDSRLFSLKADIYGACAVGVIDPMREISLPYSALQQALDFTGAEARVAILLASGASPEEIASRGGVSVGTVRNQIKSIFKKASINKRSDLVRILSNLSKLIAHP